MTSNVPASPEMVKQLSESQEYELNPKTGEVRPSSSQNQAGPSPQASHEGAAGEPEGSRPEPQPDPGQPERGTQAGGVRPINSMPSQAVEVVDPQPAPTQQAAAPAEPAPAAGGEAEEEGSPEDEAEALTRLDAWFAEQKKDISEEARRVSQSQYDQREAKLNKRLEAEAAERQTLMQKVRELETRDLTEEERAKVLEVYAQQDAKAEIEQLRAETLDYHRNVIIDSLLFEYRDYDINRDDLEQLESPEEMELHCEHQARLALEQKMASGGPQPAQSAAPVETKPEPKAEEPAKPQPQPNVPAGAQAPSDVGAGGTVEEGKKFNTGKGSGALTENLRNMGWSTVRVK